MKSLHNLVKRTKKFNEIFKETELEKLDNDLNKLLVKYANYFDSYEGIRVANICGSCGKKAIPLACLRIRR